MEKITCKFLDKILDTLNKMSTTGLYFIFVSCASAITFVVLGSTSYSNGHEYPPTIDFYSHPIWIVVHFLTHIIIGYLLVFHDMKVSFIFAWYDIRIGFFWDRKKRWLYIFPVPCMGIILKFNKKAAPSINDLYEESKNLRNQYELLSADKRNSKIGIKMYKRILKLNSDMLLIERSVGRMHRPFGNYKGIRK